MDVMFLVETWHDSNSISTCRQRVEGFQVLDRPRPTVRGQEKIHWQQIIIGVMVVAVQGRRLTLASDVRTSVCADRVWNVD
jgi:hypothetical protein